MKIGFNWPNLSSQPLAALLEDWYYFNIQTSQSSILKYFLKAKDHRYSIKNLRFPSENSHREYSIQCKLLLIKNKYWHKSTTYPAASWPNIRGNSGVWPWKSPKKKKMERKKKNLLGALRNVLSNIKSQLKLLPQTRSPTSWLWFHRKRNNGQKKVLILLDILDSMTYA